MLQRQMVDHLEPSELTKMAIKKDNAHQINRRNEFLPTATDQTSRNTASSSCSQRHGHESSGAYLTRRSSGNQVVGTIETSHTTTIEPLRNTASSSSQRHGQEPSSAYLAWRSSGNQMHTAIQTSHNTAIQTSHNATNEASHNSAIEASPAATPSSQHLQEPSRAYLAWRSGGRQIAGTMATSLDQESK